MKKIHLIATAAFGIEAVVGRELKNLGFDDQYVENGKVTFSGDLGSICKTNLWLRTADRILVKLGEFKALTFDELFEKTKALPWDEWITRDAQFPVDGKSVDSKLASISDCQAIVKKAIVEKLKQKYKCSWFEETGPRFRVEVSILKDQATLTIDSSGTGLHKRGYRTLVGGAPLKETMACAMLLISRWKGDRILLDPFCGSGTIPIEAAMISLNIAPGINRNFDFENWPIIDKTLWNDYKEQAKSLILNAANEIRISGTDISEEALSISRYHAKKAGVDSVIHFQKMPVSDIKSRHKYGFIICNPPYGERLGHQKDIEKLYKDIGKVFSSFDTWSYYILSNHMEFEKLFGRKADKKRKLFNGRLLCNYYQFYGPVPPKTPHSNSYS